MIGQLRQFGGEAGIVLFFPGVKAGVLQHQHVAARHALDRLLRHDADAILGEAHPLPQHLTQCRGDRRQ